MAKEEPRIILESFPDCSNGQYLWQALLQAVKKQGKDIIFEYSGWKTYTALQLSDDDIKYCGVHLQHFKTEGEGRYIELLSGYGAAEQQTLPIEDPTTLIQRVTLLENDRLTILDYRVKRNQPTLKITKDPAGIFVDMDLEEARCRPEVALERIVAAYVAAEPKPS